MSFDGMIAEPVFLVGSERSGTTLLRLMLSGHPQMAWNQGLEYAVERLPEGDGFVPLPDYYRFLETDRVFLMSGFTIDRSLTYPELVNSFLAQQRGDRPVVGAVVLRNFDRLPRIWPKARFIHVLRDGRDVSRSVVEMGWAGNSWAGTAVWTEAETLWDKLSKEVPPQRQMTVRFEDLIPNTVGELTRICEFCGLGYDPAMLDYPKHSTYALPDTKMVGSWKRKMSAQEVQQVESRIGPLLQARGYPLSDYPSVRLNPLREKWLRLHNYWGRKSFRVRRFGVPLLVQDFVTRRLHLNGWQAKVRMRMNAIENQHLK